MAVGHWWCTYRAQIASDPNECCNFDLCVKDGVAALQLRVFERVKFKCSAEQQIHREVYVELADELVAVAVVVVVVVALAAAVAVGSIRALIVKGGQTFQFAALTCECIIWIILCQPTHKPSIHVCVSVCVCESALKTFCLCQSVENLWCFP